MNKTYFATCTFDLKNGSSQDYQNAYVDLAKLGFARVVVSGDGKTIALPTTTTAGKFNGVSAAKVRDDLGASIDGAFTARKFVYERFVVVGGIGRGDTIRTRSEVAKIGSASARHGADPLSVSSLNALELI